MKNTSFKKCLAVIAICICGSLSADAQIVVKIKPGPAVVWVQSARPGPRHVWIRNDYVIRGGQYEYAGGYWAAPPPKYKNWKEGHWSKRRGGWVWIPGHWR